MAEFITVIHPDVDEPARVPMRALHAWEQRGWLPLIAHREPSPSAPVDENPSDAPAPDDITPSWGGPTTHDWEDQS